VEPAGKLLAAAKSAAGKLKNVWFDFNIEERERRRDRLVAWDKHLERARRKLAEASADAEANLLAGMALGPGLGDWDNGLSFLARGGALAARIAKLEKAEPRSPEDRLALAEAWWNLAAVPENPDDPAPRDQREAARERAFFWYEQALPGLKGVARVEVENRIGERSPRYLSDLQELEARVGHGEFGKGGKVGSGAGDITVNGLASPHGLYLHGTQQGDSFVRYRLGGRYKKLEALVALNDSADRPHTAVTFIVEGDGKVLWKSAPIKQARRPQALTVDIAGVAELKLLVRCPGHYHMTHAVWLEPAVVR
jgi:hypothetical protein